MESKLTEAKLDLLAFIDGHRGHIDKKKDIALWN
jgi:hypothetical protein